MVLIEAAVVGISVGTIIYIVRKIREYQWGWVRNKSSLKDKIFIVTGANTGLGFEATKHLVNRGATVILGCRNANKANEAIAGIEKITKNGRMIFIELDLASFDSIKKFAQTIKTDYSRFDCLVNNAGLAINGKKQFTKENYEIHFGTNHLGHFFLYQLLEENIRQNSSRVVVVSSKMHEHGKIDFETLGKYDDSQQPTKRTNPYYNNSKLANFYFVRELYKKGIDCHVLCPGLCHTDFFRDYNPKWYHYIMFSPIVWLMLRSAEQGAQNIIHCATDNKNTEEKNPSTGFYIRSLVQTKSKVEFDEEVSTRLWNESVKMCSLKL